MGNSMYRASPRRIFNSSSGNSAHFQFAANQITGWRNSQEDRYVCLPNFYKDFSLFAVYDGHGGGEVVQYLERFLHQFISMELELTKDVELALYLSFLNCDSSLRSISAAEHALIENDLEKEFEVPDKTERRRALFNAVNAAGTSGANQVQDELRAAIANACLKELPSISFLTQAPMQESDESDDEYQPGDEDINFFTEEIDSSDQSENASESYSSESIEEDNMDVHDSEKKTENIFKEDTGCSTRAKEKKEEQNCSEEDQKVILRKVGMHCGSTATVLLINPKKIYIAHVGDSRCVACIKGQAVDLSTDHRPDDKEEYDRIINADGTVQDGRIEGIIDMSRAFGDFCFKVKDNPFQIVSAEPGISSLEISPDLEFIIVASDGIWNTMDSVDVIDYIRKRISDPSLELQDLCGELFEELLPQNVTTDGSGCDNMTAVLIKFINTQELSSKNVFCCREIYEYRYPPANKSDNSSTNKSDNSSTNKSDNSSTAENSNHSKDCCQLMLEARNPNHECIICYESENHEKSNFEIDNARGVDRSSSEQGYSSENIKEKTLKNAKELQQLHKSNENYRGTGMAAQTDQQKMNSSESCKENSSQLRRNARSNVLQNHPLKSGDNEQSIIFHHSNAMGQIIQSLSNIERAVKSLASNISLMQKYLHLEIRRFNHWYLNVYSTNLTSTVSQSPMETDVVDSNDENIQTKEQSIEQNVSHVDCATVQSPSMQMETHLVNVTAKRIQNAEHSVEKNVNHGVMQLPTKQMEAEFVDRPSKEIQISKQSVLEEIVPSKTTTTNEINLEQSIEKDEDAECKSPQSPSIQILKEVVKTAELIDLSSDDSESGITSNCRQPIAKVAVNLQSVNSAVKPTMQMETDLIDSTYEEISPPEQSPEQGEVESPSDSVDSVVLQPSTMLIETDPNKDLEALLDSMEQSIEQQEANFQIFESARMQSPTMQIETDPVNRSNEEIKSPEQSVEQAKIKKFLESPVMELPSLQAVTDLVNVTNEEKLATVQSVNKNEEEKSCKKSIPSKNVKIGRK